MATITSNIESEQSPLTEKVQILKTVQKTEEPDVVEYKLQIGSKVIILPMNKKGYINVTSLAKATRKRLDTWHRKPETKGKIEQFTKLPQFAEVLPYYTHEGRIGGTYMHPILATGFACYCYPEYSLQVGMWINELQTTGSVKLGEEKTQKELEEATKRLFEQAEEIEKKNEEIEKAQIENRTLQKRHEAILYKRNRPSLKRGPCFYILYEAKNPNCVKIGHSSNFQKRYYDHVTANDVQMAFIAYLEDNVALENLVKIKYRTYTRNHSCEWLENVDYNEIIEYVETTLKGMNVTYTTHKKIEEIHVDENEYYEKETTIKEKQCTGCKKTKEVTEFAKDRMKKDGFHSRCRECDKKRKEAYKKKEKVEITEKICISCKDKLPVSEFLKHLSTKDGFTASCKKCINTTKTCNRLKDKENGMLYTCKNCMTTFTRKDALVTHVKTYCKIETKQNIIKVGTETKLNTSGIKGVYFQEIPDARWIAQWIDIEGKKRKKTFSVKMHGEEKAKELAIQAREENQKLKLESQSNKT